MPIFKLKTILLAGAASALACPGVASAQSAGSDQSLARASGDDGVIIVTARKRAESDIDVPVAIDVVSAAKLERGAVSNISDMQQLVPGLVISETTANLGGTIALRGISTAAANSAIEQGVSVNIDGMQISHGMAVRFGQFDLQQVEVLKGPQSLFYGKNATAGIISLVTAGPTKQLEAGLTAKYGFVADEAILDGYISGPINDDIGFRIAGRYRDQKGYWNNNAPGGGNGVGAFGSYGPATKRWPSDEEMAVRGTLEYNAGGAFRAIAKVGYNRTESAGAIGAQQLIYCPRGAPQSTRTLPGIDECKRDRTISSSDNSPATLPFLADLGVTKNDATKIVKQTLATLAMDLDLTEHLTISSTTGYNILDYTNFDDNAMASQSGFPIYADVSKKTFSEELRLTSNYDGPVNFLLGAFYADDKHQDVGQAFIGIGGGRVSAFPRTDQELGTKTFSIFGQTEVTFANVFKVSVGARYTDEKKTIDKFFLPFVGARGVDGLNPNLFLPNELKVNNISPEVTVSYQPSQDVNVYASYREAFKSGGWSWSLLSVSGAVAAGATQRISYDPEYVRGFEGGIKARLLDNQLRMNLAVYRYKYSDLQLSNFDPATISVKVINAGSAVNKGIDFDLSYAPNGVPGLTLEGSISYLDAKYTEFFNACYNDQSQSQGCSWIFNNGYRKIVAGERGRFQNLAGASLTKAPKWTGQFNVNYETPISNDLFIGFNFGGNFRDDIILFEERAPGSIDPSVWKFDASIRVGSEDKRWEIALVGNNLTDKLSANHGTQQPFGGGADDSGTVAGGPGPDVVGWLSRPREIWIQTKFKF